MPGGRGSVRRGETERDGWAVTGGQEVPGSNPGSPTRRAWSEGLFVSLEMVAPPYYLRMRTKGGARAVLVRVACLPYLMKSAERRTRTEVLGAVQGVPRPRAIGPFPCATSRPSHRGPPRPLQVEDRRRVSPSGRSTGLWHRDWRSSRSRSEVPVSDHTGRFRFRGRRVRGRAIARAAEVASGDGCSEENSWTLHLLSGPWCHIGSVMRVIVWVCCEPWCWARTTGSSRPRV